MHTYKRSSTQTHTHTSRSKVNTAASLTLDVRRMEKQSSALTHTHTNSARLEKERERERENEFIERAPVSQILLISCIPKFRKKKINNEKVFATQILLLKTDKKERKQNSRP